MEKNRLFHIWIFIAASTLLSVVLVAQDARNDSAASTAQGQSSKVSQSPSADQPKQSRATGNGQKHENFNYYSIEQEIQLGKEFAAQVDATAVLIHDPVVVEYISRVGHNLARNSEPKFTFTFRVIDSPEPRAFALPGGIVYINSGLLQTADNEAELAAVMAHAIAHVNARHVTRMFSRTEFINLMQKPSKQKSTLPDYCSMYAMCEKDESDGVPPVFFKFSRNFETEADWLGVQYVYKAGYDPNGFLSFLGRREQIEKKEPLPVAQFPTHPTTAERISVIEKEIASILKAQERYTVDTEEFQAIKTRLSNLKTQGLHAAAKR